MSVKLSVDPITFEILSTGCTKSQRRLAPR